jgi:hypothetical protein
MIRAILDNIIGILKGLKPNSNSISKIFNINNTNRIQEVIVANVLFI